MPARTDRTDAPARVATINVTPQQAGVLLFHYLTGRPHDAATALARATEFSAEISYADHRAMLRDCDRVIDRLTAIHSGDAPGSVEINADDAIDALRSGIAGAADTLAGDPHRHPFDELRKSFDHVRLCFEILEQTEAQR
jgi:hypothetical protein